MANKVCSKKEKCVHGNIPQSYENFHRDITRYDQHKSECKDCLQDRRDKRKNRQKELYNDQFDFFIGSK